MFFKELACLYCLVINVHLLLFVHATALLYYHVLFYLSTTFFNFFQLVFALSKKALKTRCFSVVCCCRVQQPWILYTLAPTKVNTILQTFSKPAL